MQLLFEKKLSADDDAPWTEVAEYQTLAELEIAYTTQKALPRDKFDYRIHIHNRHDAIDSDARNNLRSVGCIIREIIYRDVNVVLSHAVENQDGTVTPEVMELQEFDLGRDTLNEYLGGATDTEKTRAENDAEKLSRLTSIDNQVTRR